MPRPQFALIVLIAAACASCAAEAAAQETQTQTTPEYLTYEQVLERWDRSRAYGDPRDLRQFATDMNTLHGDKQNFSAAFRDTAWLRSYARCEQIFGDATDIALIAAAAALAFAFYRYVILPLQKMPAAASGGQAIASAAIDAKFRGVQGWLLFLCIWTTVLWPLFTFAGLHRMSEEWMYLFTGVMVFAIASGVMLWRALPAGLVLVRTFLVVVAALNLISVFLYGQADPDRVPLALLQCAIPVAWLVYTFQSRRVRGTFSSPSSSS